MLVGEMRRLVKMEAEIVMLQDLSKVHQVDSATNTMDGTSDPKPLNNPQSNKSSFVARLCWSPS